jgi:hypothetical protein
MVLCGCEPLRCTQLIPVQCFTAFRILAFECPVRDRCAYVDDLHQGFQQKQSRQGTQRLAVPYLLLHRQVKTSVGREVTVRKAQRSVSKGQVMIASFGANAIVNASSYARTSSTNHLRVCLYQTVRLNVSQACVRCQVQ